MKSKVVVPAEGKKITPQNGKFNVPENPTIPFIEGDGIGVDVAPLMIKAVDTAVGKVYKGEREIPRMEIYTGEKSAQVYSQDVWLSAETLDLIREYRAAIKGPLTTLVGGGIRSLNVVLRQEPSLYVYLRPARCYQGISNPVKHPELTDIVTFRENSEDIYAGTEWKADSADAEKVIEFLREEMGMKKARSPEHCGIGTKPCSEEGTKRLVCVVTEYAIANDRDSAILVYKGNIMKFTEGALKDWDYQLAREEFGSELTDGGPWAKTKNPKTGEKIVAKDVIADASLQQILLCPAEYDAIACMNLNGDYIPDTSATQVGGIGIASGANIGDRYTLLETTHGTVPKYAGQDKVNPGSTILSAETMLCHMDWVEAADPIIKGMGGAISAKTATYDFERLMGGAKLLKCSEFGDAIVENM